ncbi:CPBP family intramembrane glutamic endopeptidase [Corynebacterium nasicanis]|uniref:CPBP family intramembrane glutamic endopeptidase n=1 Tax=Corynebacterium nasicanis TaxID=1448267 RepID=A0ABW1Q9U4_9CORY
MTTNLTAKTPLLPVTWWGLLIRALLGFALLMGANLARVPFHTWAAQRWPDGDAQLAATSLIFLLTPLLIIAAVALWMRLVERASLSVTTLTNFRALLPGFAGGLLLAGLAVLLGWIVLAAVDAGTAEVPTLDGNDMEGTYTAVLLVFLFIRAVLLQGLPEELIYRGWFFHVTRHRPWLTLAWTTVAFTVIHLLSSGGQENAADRLFYLITPLGMGFLAGAVVLWRRSVWWAVGTHGGLHIWMAVGSVIHPVDLGRAAWIVLGVTQLLVGAVILWMWQRGRTGASVGLQ